MSDAISGFMEKLRDSGALDALLACLVKTELQGFAKLSIASPVVARHVQKSAARISYLAWGISSSDPSIDWHQELKSNVINAYNASHTELEVYYLDDEKKTPEQLRSCHSRHRISQRDSDSRGTVEIKYVQNLPLRAKPLTALDLCFSGEHEEVAVSYPKRTISFVPTNAGAVMYFEVTLTSLAKRNGGPTIGYCLPKPYSMPGTSWYSVGYAVDSDILRVGVAIPPVKGIASNKKPRVGSVWGVGYIVHEARERFCDDNNVVQPPGQPCGLTYFVTLNGKLKFRMYVSNMPLFCQPAAMLANTGDGLLYNLVGDVHHPFQFNLNTISDWALPLNYERMPRDSHAILFGPGTNPTLPLVPPNPFAKAPEYKPLSKKVMALSKEELATWGIHRHSTIVGSCRQMTPLADSFDAVLPVFVSRSFVDIDINAYYSTLCPLLERDEAINLLLNFDPQDSANLLAAEAPQEQLQGYTHQVEVHHLTEINHDLATYITNFTSKDKINLPEREAGAPPHTMWIDLLYSADHPFPLSMATHRAIKAIKLLTDSSVNNLAGIYRPLVTYLESITDSSLLEMLRRGSYEIAWAQAQMWRILLKLPCTPNPRIQGEPKNEGVVLASCASYRWFAEIVYIMIVEGMTTLQGPWPTDEEIDAWLEARIQGDRAWAESFIWNGYLSIPLYPIKPENRDPPETEAKSFLPEDYAAAMKVLINKHFVQYQQYLRSSQLDTSTTFYLLDHVLCIQRLIEMCDRNTMYSLRNCTAFSSPLFVSLLRPLPLPTDPPVPGTPPMRLRGYQFAQLHIGLLAFIFGKDHFMLAPLLDWSAHAFPGLLQEATEQVREWYRNTAQATVGPNPEPPIVEYLKPIPLEKRSRRLRPVSAALVGLSAAAALAGIGYMGYRLASALFPRKKE